MSKAARGVTTLEAIKGLVVVLAGFGTLSLVHRDVPQHAAAAVTDSRLWLLAVFAARLREPACHRSRWAMA